MQPCGLRIGSFLGASTVGTITAIEKTRKQKEELVLARVFAFMSAKTRLPSTLRWEVTVKKESFFLKLSMNHYFMTIVINKGQGLVAGANEAGKVVSQILRSREKEEASCLFMETKNQYVFLISAFSNNKRDVGKLALEVKKVEVVWGELERKKAFIELRKKCNSLAISNGLISFCAIAPPVTVIMTCVAIQLNGFRRGSFSSRNEESFNPVFLAMVAITSLLFVATIIQTASAARDYSFKGSQSFESYQKATRDLKSGRVDFL